MKIDKKKHYVVLNKCYGGFSLSPYACEAYLKEQNKKAYFYVSDLAIYPLYKLVTVKEAAERSYFFCFSKNMGKKVDVEKIPDKEYNKYHFDDRGIGRCDPILIKIVNKLGKKADGKCAELVICEMLESFDNYQIDEYDGMESLVTKYERIA